MEELLKMFESKEVKVDKSIYRGFTVNSDRFLVKKLLELNFIEVSEFGNGVRWVYVNKELKSVYTYCEGDISLEIFKEEKDYENNYEKIKEFYEMYM